MFKKILISFSILLTLFININICSADTSSEDKENVKNIAHQFVDILFSDFFDNVKKAYNENVAIHYNKTHEWFDKNIKPKIENILSKTSSTDEYLKEKEEIKSELPGFLEQVSNFFKSFVE
jgi:glycosylphosphatidylinositol transamidase (GPIT) subunit GPI8